MPEVQVAYSWDSIIGSPKSKAWCGMGSGPFGPRNLQPSPSLMCLLGLCEDTFLIA